MKFPLNRYTGVFLSVVVLCISFNCSTGVSTEPDTESTQEKSELASLMRVMELHGDEVRKALKNGAALPPPPEGIDELLTAEPTPNMRIEQQTFPVFAQEYLKGIDALYKVESKKQQDAYNTVIMSCSNCHTVNCPGPLMKIDKMFIDFH
jgi:hypothetical protein